MASLLFIYSCNTSSPGGNASTAQKNMDAAHTINKAFETGDTTGLDNVVDANFLDHTDHGDVKGRDSLKSMIRMVHGSSKDLKMILMSEAADSDMVFDQMHFKGTGDGVTMPAGPFEMHAIELTRYKDGKAIEHWTYGDEGEMVKMMEKMYSPGNKPMDSTHKM